jgi:predicted nucleotidyltransferase
MKFREGDFIETYGGLIFDVKGFVHPPDRVVAFIRYFLDPEGERTKSRLSYGKVYSLSRRYALLKERFPRYLVYDPVFDETLCEVPVKDLKKRYDPLHKTRTLRRTKNPDALQSSALKLAELLKKEADVPWNTIGITGSILVGLHNSKSDIDLIIYGSDNSRKVHSSLRDLLTNRKTPLRPYDRDELERLFDFRSKDTETSFEDFVRTENRKVLQGKFGDKDYFIRFVKDWNELQESYGQVTYKNLGYATVAATIEDDAESIFTPCSYAVNNVRILKGSRFKELTDIASFRGRFCEQARKGETVIAQGKVELLRDVLRGREYLRLLLGNNASDFMIGQTTRKRHG